MFRNRHQSGGTSAGGPLRQMTARRHKNLHFSREIRPPPPPPPNDSAKGEKSAYLSGNSTLSANCLGWRRGGGMVKIMLDIRTFLPFRQWPSLAEGLRAVATEY